VKRGNSRGNLGGAVEECFAEFILVSRSSERSEEEILRYAQNDRKSEVLPQNDRGRRAPSE
jgi:hypothetical protein